MSMISIVIMAFVISQALALASARVPFDTCLSLKIALRKNQFALRKRHGRTPERHLEALRDLVEIAGNHVESARNHTKYNGALQPCDYFKKSCEERRSHFTRFQVTTVTAADSLILGSLRRKTNHRMSLWTQNIWMHLGHPPSMDCARREARPRLRPPQWVGWPPLVGLWDWVPVVQHH